MLLDYGAHHTKQIVNDNKGNQGFHALEEVMGYSELFYYQPQYYLP